MTLSIDDDDDDDVFFLSKEFFIRFFLVKLLLSTVPVPGTIFLIFLFYGTVLFLQLHSSK